jgi:rubrerythrin
VGDEACPKTRAVLNRLAAATEVHWRTVSEALDQAKRTPADAQRA